MMTVTISNGIVILLLFLQNTYAQQGVSNNVVNNAGLSQPTATCNSAGVNFNSPQPGQQINWQQMSNLQQAPVSQQPQNLQPGVNLQLNQNSLSDIISALHNLRSSTQKPQVANQLPTASGSVPQTSIQQSPVPNNPQYVSQVQESPKPTFTFQFVPATQQNKGPENQQVMQNALPIQYLTSGQSQMTSQQGPTYYIPNQPELQNSQTGQPIILTLSTQQPTSGQSQPIVYTLQPPARNNQPKSQTTQGPNKSDNPMALLMSQLQSPSGNLDISSILPMLMNTKQEKSGGMKALLPLILNMLNDKGCGCPHCGCPYKKDEPTINGGYSNQINYSQQDLSTKVPERKVVKTKSAAKSIEESGEIEVPKVSKKYKTNVISDLSEETSEEDDEYEDYDDDDD